MMSNRDSLTDDFFDQYSANFNATLRQIAPDLEKTAVFFAECFIGSGPEGVNCGKNNDQFRKYLEQGYAFYKSIGITSMDILAKEITLLDDFHAMAKIHWRSEFTRKDQSTGKIDFSVIYFVREKDNAPKIFAYIAGDEQKALKENGLV